ncbi:MAG: hypothetical protein KDI88_05195 [Gammaproteobacteria bacterium]|nr:hypothetical protein [Gammaproteobacteria bacterium]
MTRDLKHSTRVWTCCLALFACSESLAGLIEIPWTVRGGAQERYGEVTYFVIDEYNVNNERDEPNHPDELNLEHRGMLEFDLTGVDPAFTTATLSGDLLFEGFPPVYLALYAYAGDGLLTPDDFHRGETLVIETVIDARSLAIDVTEVIREAIAADVTYLGFNLRDPVPRFYGAYLGINETLRIQTVDSPTVFLLLLWGSLLVFAARFRQHRSASRQAAW